MAAKLMVGFIIYIDGEKGDFTIELGVHFLKYCVQTPIKPIPNRPEMHRNNGVAGDDLGEILYGKWRRVRLPVIVFQR